MLVLSGMYPSFTLDTLHYVHPSTTSPVTVYVQFILLLVLFPMDEDDTDLI
jgi:hypothetical protein